MRIGVDADEVVIDLLTHWLRLYNSDYDDNLTPNDITGWDLALFVKPECGVKIYDYLELPDLYVDCDLIPGAQDAVFRLREAGHDVVTITAKHNPSKLDLLQRWGIVRSQASYIVEKDKWKVPVDVLVDDNYETIKKYREMREGSCAILFSQKHNESLAPGYYWRAYGWGGVMTLIADHELTSQSKLKLAKIAGIGPEAPTVVNEKGGKQSALDYRFDLIDPKTMFVLAGILSDGAKKYGEWNWKKLSKEDNINHALSHLFAALDNDPQDDHLGHAFCRVMFALSQELEDE